jgi:hypothetical protein
MPFYKQPAIFLHHIHTSERVSCSRDTDETDRDRKHTGTGNTQGQETDREWKRTGIRTGIRTILMWNNKGKK